MPRWTGTSSFGTSANLIVLFWPGPDRLGEVLADLVGVDVEGGRELDVADVVAAEVDVHQTRDLLVRIRVLVVLDALHEGGGAVAHADDRHAHLLGLVARGAVGLSVAAKSCPPVQKEAAQAAGRVLGMYSDCAGLVTPAPSAARYGHGIPAAAP